jgi:hypothetical protein
MATKVLTVKEALDNLDKWSLQPTRMNRTTHKKEAPILFNGDVVCVQIGTPQHPIWCGKGVERWSQKDGKFLTVDGSEGVQWAYADAAASQFERKTPGGKVQAQLTLHEHTVENTQGFFTYLLLKGIEHRIIQGLAHGVPDPSTIDPTTGKPKIVKVVDIPNAPADPVERERMFRFSMASSIREGTGTFAPTLRTKIRYNVKKTTAGEAIELGIDVLNANDKPPVALAAGKQLDVFKARTAGVFVIKFNPLQFKRNEVNMTIDLVTAWIKPSTSIFKNVGIRYDEDDDSLMDGNDQQNNETNNEE